MTDFTSVKIRQETDESIENIGDWKEVELSSDIKDEETNRFEFEEDIIDAFEHEGDNEKFQKEAIKENLENVSEQDPLRDVLRNEKYDRNKSKVCKICNATYTRPVNLKRHIESVHEGKKPFKCSECDSSFTQSGHLKKHIETVHEKNKSWVCEFCQKSFCRKDQLNSHIISIHPGNESFQCNLCDLSFMTENVLRKHTVTSHTGMLY